MLPVIALMLKSKSWSPNGSAIPFPTWSSPQPVVQAHRHSMTGGLKRKEGENGGRPKERAGGRWTGDDGKMKDGRKICEPRLGQRRGRR
eukprot:599676-Rhodomonas_salina.2